MLEPTNFVESQTVTGTAIDGTKYSTLQKFLNVTACVARFLYTFMETTEGRLSNIIYRTESIDRTTIADSN